MWEREKHVEATSIQLDVMYLNERVDRGGEYIVTHMFCDHSEYFEYVEPVRAALIKVPIIP